VGVEHRLAGGDVELPAVPRTPDDLAVALPAVLAGALRDAQPREQPLTEGGELVGTDVRQRVELAVDVEHADREPLDVDEQALAGRQVGRPADLVAAHQPGSS
jgi:hypothetical protein